MTIAKDAYEHYEAGGKAAGFLPLVENVRVLEIGFGTGALMEALRTRGNSATTFCRSSRISTPCT